MSVIKSIKLVQVTWSDSAADDAWVGRDEFEDMVGGNVVIETVGFQVRQLKDKIVLVQSICGTQVCGYFEIPKGCIKKVKTICRVKIKMPAWV